MIQITDKIWIGDSDDEKGIERVLVRKQTTITGVLNVAADLKQSYRQTRMLECMHIGLIDGPGNTSTSYTAAIMALAVLLERHDSVLVCCHTGSRSLAIVVMYQIIKSGMNSEHPTFLNYWIPWDKMLDSITSRVKSKLPRIHPAHKEVFDKMALSLIEALI